VVTTTTEENVIALLKRQLPGSVDEWFELIAAGDVVKNKKPAPDIYRWAMERMALSSEECLAVEDSRNGLLAAKQAGINSVIITFNGYTEQESFSEAALVVDQLGTPRQPCSVQKSTIGPFTQVDVSLLNTLHAQVHSDPAN